MTTTVLYTYILTRRFSLLFFATFLFTFFLLRSSCLFFSFFFSLFLLAFSLSLSLSSPERCPMRNSAVETVVPGTSSGIRVNPPLKENQGYGTSRERLIARIFHRWTIRFDRLNGNFLPVGTMLIFNEN